MKRYAKILLFFNVGSHEKISNQLQIVKTENEKSKEYCKADNRFKTRCCGFAVVFGRMLFPSKSQRKA